MARPSIESNGDPVQRPAPEPSFIRASNAGRSRSLQHQAVAVVVDERPGDVRRRVVGVHAVSSTFSSESDRRRASPGDAIITTATSSTQPNATTGNQRAGLSSG